MTESPLLENEACIIVFVNECATSPLEDPVSAIYDDAQFLSTVLDIPLIFCAEFGSRNASAEKQDQFFAQLASTARSTVIICGANTEASVLNATTSILKEGYDLFLVSDWLYSTDLIDRELAFEPVRRCGGFVWDSKMLLAALAALPSNVPRS